MIIPSVCAIITGSILGIAISNIGVAWDNHTHNINKRYQDICKIERYQEERHAKLKSIILANKMSQMNIPENHMCISIQNEIHILPISAKKDIMELYDMEISQEYYTACVLHKYGYSCANTRKI